MKLFAALCVAASIALAPAHADDWPSARPMEIASPDGRVVARITPGNSLGDVEGFAGAGKGVYARSSIHRVRPDGTRARVHAIRLLNPVAPVEAVLSDAGELVTFDNWHNLGYGRVVVVYDQRGRVRRSYALADLYTPPELERFQRSVSSIRWRCGRPVLDAAARNVAFSDVLGNRLRVDLKTGAVSRSPGATAC